MTQQEIEANIRTILANTTHTDAVFGDILNLLKELSGSGVVDVATHNNSNVAHAKIFEQVAANLADQGQLSAEALATVKAALEQAIATKADTTATEEALNLKANTEDVARQLALKASLEVMLQELALKADTRLVEAGLSLKADTKTMQQELGKKSNLGHVHGNEEITGLDAGKITSGTVDLARMPAAALERLVPVTNRAALLALTTTDIQNGDTAQQIDTGVMYRVVNQQKLGTMEAFREYTAGMAASVPWSGVQGKPVTFAPTAHAGSHGKGGSDEITPEAIGAASTADLASVRTVANAAKSAAETANAKAVTAQNTANAAKTQADRGVSDAATSQATANAARADAERALAEMSGAGMPSNRIIALNAATLGSAGCAAPADGYVVCYVYTNLPATNLWFSLSNTTAGIASPPLVFPDGNGFHCSISCKKGDLVKAHNPYPSLITCATATFYYANGAI